MKIGVDLSSVLGAYLHIKDEEYGIDVEFEGKNIHIPDVETCLERFQATVENLDADPSEFIVVKDPGGLPKARTRIFPPYKQRPRTMPPEFHDTRKELFNKACDWLRSEGAIIATPKNFTEADDLLNQLAIRLPEIMIWTRDKDLLACPCQVLFQDAEGFHLDPEKFPVPREFIHTYRTIVLGDASDNVPSCKGFGDKAWQKMIAIFGEDAIAELDDMLQNKTLDVYLPEHVKVFAPFQLLIDQAEELYKYYRVLSFHPVPAHQIRWEGGVVIGPKTLVTADNFAEVYESLRQEVFDYSVIDYEADTGEESKLWCEQAEVKVDVLGQEITGMGLRINKKNYYFSVDHAETNNISLQDLSSVLELLLGKPIFAHNASFENTVTYMHFDTLLPEMVDTALMASYVDENDGFFALKSLSWDWLKMKQASYQETLAGKPGMRSITGEEVLSYGIDDVIATDGLKNIFEVIMHYEDTYNVFQEVENDALYFTTLAFINGVDFDDEEYIKMKAENDNNIRRSWTKLSAALLNLGWEGGVFKPITSLNFPVLNKVHKTIYGKEIKNCTAVGAAINLIKDKEFAKLVADKNLEEINKMYQQHWRPEAEFSVRSSPDMKKLLYEVLEVPVRLRNKPTPKMRAAGKRGNPAANEDAIMNAIAYNDTPHVDLLKLLIEHKGYLTRHSLFFEKWPSYVHWKTGKIHCSMRQSATTTRRFSHSKPNNGQLPKKKGKEVRNMMTVSDESEWYIFALDIDSQELILQAWQSQDPNFLSCYIGEDKKDVHALTGFQVARKQGKIYTSYDEFASKLDGETKPFRVSGKATNFATAYLCRAPKLATMLCVTEESAQDFMDAKAEAFPQLLPATYEYIRKCQKRGYARTMLGARRHLHGRQHFGSRKEFEREAAGRLSWSFRIQGSGAEQVKLAAGRMYREGLFDDGLCWPITIIHDEIVGRIHKSVLEERMPKLYACVCQRYANMGIQTSSTPEIGSHFGSLKEYKMKEAA